MRAQQQIFLHASTDKDAKFQKTLSSNYRLDFSWLFTIPKKLIIENFIWVKIYLLSKQNNNKNFAVDEHDQFRLNSRKE